MSTQIFYITTTGGKNYTGQSKEILNDQFGALEAGRHKVSIQKVGAYERPSRYKFYWAVVLTAILDECGRLFYVTNPETGEQTMWTSTDEVHDHMKRTYNPRILTTPKGIFVVPGSTKELGDSEFVNKYMEQIMADFSQPPFNVEFKDPETWKAEMKAKRESQT